MEPISCMFSDKQNWKDKNSENPTKISKQKYPNTAKMNPPVQQKEFHLHINQA